MNPKKRKWKVKPMTSTSPRYVFSTHHQQAYIMSGHNFQEVLFHGADVDPECKSQRLSLTFRLTRATAERTKIDFSQPRPNSVRWCEKLTQYSFADVWREIQYILEPDITFVFGRHTNQGRMTAELMVGHWWPEPSIFQYKYGKKIHFGQFMGPVVNGICGEIQAGSGRLFDWCHITYYPDGKAKLGKHSDNEDVIQPYSDIACVSLMSETTASRTLFFSSARKK